MHGPHIKRVRVIYGQISPETPGFSTLAKLSPDSPFCSPSCQPSTPSKASPLAIIAFAMPSYIDTATVSALSTEEISAEFSAHNDPKFKSPRVRCKWCGKVQTANVSRERAHLMACDQFRRSQRQKVQKTILHHVIRPVPQGLQATATRMAATAVFTMGLPFSLLKSPGMKDLFSVLNPGWKPPSAGTISNLLPEV